MYVLALRHRVRDYDSWKRVFDGRLDDRVKGDVVGHRLTRSVLDPNEVEVVMRYRSREAAEAYRDYMQRPETREALTRAGVEEQAPLWIGEVAEARDYD
jgi:heme-degrading monooxygenase HmoA